MCSLIEVKLDEKKVMNYLELIVGESSDLTQSLLQSHTWEFTVVAPQLTPRPRLYQFEVGGLCNASQSQNWVIQYYKNELQKYINVTFIVDDLYALPSDGFIKKVNSGNSQVVGNSVIYAAHLNINNTFKIFDIVNNATSYNISCFITRGHLKKFDTQEISLKLLGLFFPIYDQESFLICRPVNALPPSIQ